MKKAILSAATAVVVALALGLSRGSQASPAADGQKTEQYQVKIDNFSFWAGNSHSSGRRHCDVDQPG